MESRLLLVAHVVSSSRATGRSGSLIRRTFAFHVAIPRALAVAFVVAFVAGDPPLASAAGAPTVSAYNAPYLGSPAASAPAAIAVTAARSGTGYYVLRANGSVTSYGATNYGSPAAFSLASGTTATGIALDPVTGGYWVLLSNGRVSAFNAPNLGETLVPPGGWGQHPAAVAIAAAANGGGYYVLRANGAVNGYGVKPQGSLAGTLHYGATAPVLAVGIAVDAATGGYWLVTSTGRVVGFDAPDYGSPLASAHGVFDGDPVTGIAATSDGTGYDIVRASGAVNSFHAALTPAATSETMARGAFASAITLDPTTGGYYLAIDDTSFYGYDNPLRGVTSLLPQEVDQGVDYCGSGPIFAIGDGVVVNVFDSQWPSGVFISYRLSSGPAKGHYVYVAENVTPTVTVGERVTPATEVGVLHDAKTCLETGWADPPSTPEHAAAHLEYNGMNSTTYGLNFNALLATLGARPGLPQPDGPPGALPLSWPTW